MREERTCALETCSGGQCSLWGEPVSISMAGRELRRGGSDPGRDGIRVSSFSFSGYNPQALNTDIVSG